MLRAPDPWLPSAAPTLGEQCAQGGRAKSTPCSPTHTQAFPTTRGMGAVGRAWKHPLDGQPSVPASESYVLGCLCVPVPALPLILKEVGVESQVTHSGTAHCNLDCACDRHHCPRPGDHTDSWAMEKDIMLGFILSIATMKLALPGLSIHPSAVVVLCCHLRRRPCPFVCSLVHYAHELGSCCILMFLTTCFLCKPSTLPVWEVVVSDTKRRCASPGPVALLCSHSLSPHKPFP